MRNMSPIFLRVKRPANEEHVATYFNKAKRPADADMSPLTILRSKDLQTRNMSSLTITRLKRPADAKHVATKGRHQKKWYFLGGTNHKVAYPPS